MTAQPDHQAVRDAVAAWWNAPRYQAVWDPQQGVSTFTRSFDPERKLVGVKHSFEPQDDGSLLITWAGRFIRIQPGETFTYRARES